MSDIIDLRKYNLRDEDDAIEFLNVIVAKMPQLVKIMKDQKFKNISLQNRLEHANNQLTDLRGSQPVIDPDASVLDRMTGKHKQVAQPQSQSRLEQMKAAQGTQVTTADSVPPVDEVVETADKSELPPAPTAPGEIGNLNLAPVDPIAPDPAAVADEQPIDTTTSDTVTEDEAAEAAGSKSERTPDDGVQSEDNAELSDEAKAALEVSAPSEADKTAVGTHIAKKTAKKK